MAAQLSGAPTCLPMSQVSEETVSSIHAPISKGVLPITRQIAGEGTQSAGAFSGVDSAPILVAGTQDHWCCPADSILIKVQQMITTRESALVVFPGTVEFACAFTVQNPVAGIRMLPQG